MLLVKLTQNRTLKYSLAQTVLKYSGAAMWFNCVLQQLTFSL